MKRDLDLVRFILVCAESADASVTECDIVGFVLEQCRIDW